MVNLLLLAYEYYNYPFEVENAIMFNRNPKEKSMKYITHQSAYIFTLNGRAEVTLNNEKFIAQKNTVIHGCSNRIISFNPLDNSAFSHINIYYTPFKSNSKKTDYMNTAFQLFIGNNDNINKYLQKILSISANPNLQSKFRKKTIFFSILDEMLACGNCKNMYNDKDLVDKSMEYIMNNYMKTITLESLAKLFNKTPQQFSYLFHKHTGLRPINYLIDYRMEMALKFLTIDGLNVKETAEKIGYQDPFYFSKLFKKHIGKSPRDVKKYF